MRALGLLLLSSCIGFNVGQNGQDAGTSNPPPAGDASSEGGGGAVGTGCGKDPESGATLCLGISTCPSLTIDSEAFPGCGFRITGGSAIDLECACTQYVCPIGVATTCAQAQALMANQTAATVCVQVSEGRCTGG